MAEAAPPAVRIEGLTKEFLPRRGQAVAPVRAVDGLSLRIEEDAFYGLLGPNGAGKTTTIRVLTGLTRRTGGIVEVRGLDVERSFRAVRPMIGLAPQEFDFDQFLTAREVLRYRGMYFGMERHRAERRAAELLERFRLVHKANVRVQRLSGGQKRRLLVAKALMHGPDILILDEPTAGIDVSLRHELWAYLRERNREGTTILLTTHYIEEAEALCDRIGIIDGGRLVAEGTPEALSESSGSDLVRVRLAAPWTDGLTALMRTTGLELSLAEQGQVVLARGGRGGQMASTLLSAIVQAGVRVDHVEIKRQSLEDAFITLTGKEIHAAAADAGGNV